ncbi:cyclic AMP-dependent transcription factor ATF-4 [Betta splendens]|uniref:Cyclic AMP-dependent transcription factor ATF-4 n=1 Tax=Betta splendens TaxID=158456 RepID=A0A6P7MZC1_BETSP|nr:cyclic AMP-dependent transcription factor ATF-4 [Betta splendens]XP_055364868.1 cyclic AMP-dependent transcription factor ATF-4 [Betta splendens]
MTLSQLALEDVEALYLGPSFLMADPMGPLLDQDEEEALSPSSSLEGKAPASPPLSFSSYASSLSPYQTLSSSPPPSPPLCTSSLLGTKVEADSFPWLGASDLLQHGHGADGSKDDLEAMDWMSEKIDLSEFDLDSLIGSCTSDESPSSPEDILASLDSHIELDLEAFDPDIRAQLSLSLPTIPCLLLEPPVSGPTEAKKSETFPDEEVMKSEPLSSAPSPCPPSPAYTLELGSEVDVLEAEKPSTSSAGKIITDPIQVTVPHLTIKSSPQSDSDSDSGFESAAGSPPRLPSPAPSSSSSAGSSRTKPYSKPEPTPVSPPSAKVSKVKSVSGAPKVVEKKLKKMEQNKTAATRYRQKKRVEQESLQSECDELEKKNHELKEKAESISREIQYLKDLMEEVRKHRRSKTNSVA